MRKSVLFAMTAASVCLLGGHAVWAQSSKDKGQAELAKALKGVKVSLEKGLLASEREGKPVSGGFEVVDGKLELWVFVVKGGKFLEVTVDHKSGEINEVETITDREDLAAAKKQSESMAKAKLSLRAATVKAVEANKEFRAVSVTLALKDGHPVAEITLVQGEEFKIVTEKLDDQKPGTLSGAEGPPAVEESEWNPWEPFNEKGSNLYRLLKNYTA